MFIHTDEYGRKRKFVNAKAAKQFFAEQGKRYVPDHVPVADSVTVGVGPTFDKRKPKGFRRTWQAS